MRSLVAISFCLLLAQACNKPNQSTESPAGEQEYSAEDEKAFTDVIDGIPVVKLPRKLSSMELKDIPQITKETTKLWQAKFMDRYYKDVWGRVFTESNNIHLLATQPDDQGTIFLITFNRSGKLINQDALQRGEYISADYEYSTQNLSVLEPDMTLVETDSLFKYPYDVTKNKPVGDKMCKVTHHEYQITEAGKLLMTRFDTTGFFKMQR